MSGERMRGMIRHLDSCGGYAIVGNTPIGRVYLSADELAKSGILNPQRGTLLEFSIDPEGCGKRPRAMDVSPVTPAGSW
jgi:hypothetical protein